MAAVHIGIKRPYDQIRDITYQTSTPSSGRLTALGRGSRESSETPGRPPGTDSPTIDWTETQRTTSFEPDSSIVLIGVNGVGKSSLGVLAATAYNRRLVETEKCFVDTTASTSQAYRKLHGTDAYHKTYCQVLKATLEVYAKNSVIICNFSGLEHDACAIIRAYAGSHAVVHVTRDAAGIQSYLQVWSTQRVQQLLHASGPLLRSCANYEFFNLTEKLTAINDEAAKHQTKRGGLFLTLKRVERDFLKLLRNILGDHSRVPSHRE